MRLMESATDLFTRFDSFCKAVIRNEARDLIAKEKRASDKESTLKATMQFENLIGLHTDKHDVFVERFHSRGKPYVVTDESLLVALKKLPIKELDIIVLVFWEEMLQREIAERLQVSARTVYARKVRALAKLRRWVQALEEKNKHTYDDSG